MRDQPKEKGGSVDKYPVEKTSIPSTVDPDARASEFLGRARLKKRFSQDPSLIPHAHPTIP